MGGTGRPLEGSGPLAPMRVCPSAQAGLNAKGPQRVLRACRVQSGYFEPLDERFSPPWLLRLLELLAWLRDDFESLRAELRSDLLRELLELFDCFVAMFELL
jgi:hypothetical protein